MDLDTLRAQARAARQITHPLGDVTYTLLLPTRHEVLLAARRVGAAQVGGDSAALLVLQRGILEGAIIGWVGLRVGDILPGHSEAAAPLAFEPGMVPLLLDARPDDADALGQVLTDAMAARSGAVEADAKN